MTSPRLARGALSLARRSLPLAGMVLAAFVAWSSVARAQAPPALRPPVPQVTTDVPYPAPAKGNAVVILELIVEKDGMVSQAVVIEGAEPFAEPARRAALGWRFSPARRDDVPVAARIRVRVDFRQEEASGAPPTTGPATGVGGSPSPASTDAAEEVTVRGSRHEIGETTLSATDVREVPGAFGDPFRAIEALPGVVPVLSGLPFFFIRGAPPTNNGYYLDGVRIPLLFHIGIGQGVIHPALVDRVDFYPGAPPASYGGFAGAILAGQTRDPATAFHGEANLRLIDAGALVESPLADGRGSALVAGRYGYPGPILSAVTSNVKLGYWDYQTRATWRIAERDTVGVFAFGSHDYLGTAATHNGQTGPIVDQFVSDFHRIDLRYDHPLEDGHLRAALTFGYDSQGGGGEGDTNAQTFVNNTSIALRAEVERRLSSAVRVRGGADVRRDEYHFDQGPVPFDDSGLPAQQVPSSANPPPTNVTWGAHADVNHEEV